MPKFSTRRIRDYFARSDAASTMAEKGACLEDLTVYLFEMVPGITTSARDKKNVYETEEIDVAFWNDQHPKGFKNLDWLILVECKNWSSPVGCDEVSWFLTKLRHRGLSFGILIAANGITGNARNSMQAHDLVSKAQMEKIRMIVIIRAEIEALTDSEQFVSLVKLKMCELVASGTVWP